MKWALNLTGKQLVVFLGVTPLLFQGANPSFYGEVHNQARQLVIILPAGSQHSTFGLCES